jgi:uncharacterized membrane protein YuzA (DUF378 family)
MKTIHCVAKLLVIVGALNWGLIGFFEYNVVAEIFGGPMSKWTRTIYAVVGIAGLYCLFHHFKKRCGTCGGSCGSCGCGCNSYKDHHKGN